MVSKADIKVLVTDDSKFMLMIIQQALVKNGFTNIHTANTGHDAIEMFRLLKPDIAFLDVNMKDCDGFEVIRKCRKINARAKYIIVSAFEQKELVQKAKVLGVSDYIQKPFKDWELVAAIETAMGIKSW